MALLTTGLCFIIAVPLLFCGIVDYSVMFHNNSCTIVVVVALLIIALCFIIAVPFLFCGIVDYSVMCHNMFHHSCTIFVLWHC